MDGNNRLRSAEKAALRLPLKFASLDERFRQDEKKAQQFSPLDASCTMPRMWKKRFFANASVLFYSIRKMDSEKFFKCKSAEGALLTPTNRWYIARQAWRNTCLWLPIISDVRIWCDSTCKFGAGFDEFAILGSLSSTKTSKPPANCISLSRTRFSRAARVVRNRRVVRHCERNGRDNTRIRME